MIAIKNSLQKVFFYPSAVVGLFMVSLLVFTAAYSMIKIPYADAIRLWRGVEYVWYQNPKFAPPAWINFFSAKKYSESFSVRTTAGSMTKTLNPGLNTTTI